MVKLYLELLLVFDVEEIKITVDNVCEQWSFNMCLYFPKHIWQYFLKTAKKMERNKVTVNGILQSVYLKKFKSIDCKR